MNRATLPALLLSSIISCSNPAIADTPQECSALLNTTVQTLNKNTPVNLCKEYHGKVLLIVNTASKCAFTPQYKGLESLYKKYKDQGLVVLGFPSNDFGKQEPGTEAQIKDFCKLTYDVNFPLFSKTKVTKNNADQLYKKLGTLANEYPRWNFHKYLIDRNGKLVGSYKSSVRPSDAILINKIKSSLLGSE